MNPIGKTKANSTTEPTNSGEWKIETAHPETANFLTFDELRSIISGEYRAYFLVYRLKDKTLPDCIPNREYFPNVFLIKNIALHIVEILNGKEQSND